MYTPRTPSGSWKGRLTSPNASSTAELKCPRTASPVPCTAANAEWAFCARPPLLGGWCVVVVVVVVVVWVGAVVLERGFWVGWVDILMGVWMGFRGL